MTGPAELPDFGQHPVEKAIEDLKLKLAELRDYHQQLHPVTVGSFWPRLFDMLDDAAHAIETSWAADVAAQSKERTDDPR